MTQGENRCIFCEQLHMDGIRLRGKFICKSCEEELLQTQVDEPAYETYKEGIKIIWTGELQEPDSGSTHQGSPDSNRV